MNERQAPDGVAYLDLSRSNRLSYTRSVYPVETLCTTLVSTILLRYTCGQAQATLASEAPNLSGSPSQKLLLLTYSLNFYLVLPALNAKRYLSRIFAPVTRVHVQGRITTQLPRAVASWHSVPLRCS